VTKPEIQMRSKSCVGHTWKKFEDVRPRDLCNGVRFNKCKAAGMCLDSGEWNINLFESHKELARNGLGMCRQIHVESRDLTPQKTLEAVVQEREKEAQSERV
jgi:hypothetical protein